MGSISDGFSREDSFPQGLPTAPLIEISYAKFQAKDSTEQNRFLETLKGPGFVYLNLADSKDGQRLLATVDQMFTLSEKLFALPTDEKEPFKQDYENDHPRTGFRQQGYSIADHKGNRDWSQFFNIGKTELVDESKRMPLPDLVNANRGLLRSYMEQSHTVLVTLLSRLNDALGLPPDTLSSMHRFLAQGTDQMRFTYARREDDPIGTAEGLGEIALQGHRDASTMTILFNRQGGLQILPPEEAGKPATEQKWLYVKPLAGHAVINIGDAMVTYTNGLLRSTPHRVVAPPEASPGSQRYSIVYFMRPGDEEVLRLEGSELIPPLREGEQVEAIKGHEWVKKRFRAIAQNKGIIKDHKHR